MSNEIQQKSTFYPASFESVKVTLTRSQQCIIDLINNSISKNEPITQENINEAYLLALYPNSDGMVKSSEWKYDHIKGRGYTVNVTKKLENVWNHNTRTKQWFKSNLAACIIKGKLLVLPIIEIE